MKKILLLTLTILLFAACSNEDIVTSTIPVDEGKTCELTFKVKIPEVTSAGRALGEPTIETIKSLKLLVFDENGIYLASKTATEVTPISATEGTYKISLVATSDKRIIHFIANYDGEIPYQATENSVMSQLNVTDDNDAYWQRLLLNDGISKEMNFPTVELVRNFARITLNSIAGNFELEGFVVVNKAKSGTVAPYKANAEGGFADFASSTSYDNLIQSGYTGVQPANVEIDNSIPDGYSSLYDKANKYLYERTQLKDNSPACIILKGRYNRGTTSFYRVDIINTKGSVDGYYKIFRNFSYDITIKSVVASGYASPEEAMQHAASNNLSASVELQNLLNISDGTDRLFVSVIDTTIVSRDPFLIKYKYLKNGKVANNEAAFDGFNGGKVVSSYDCTKTSWDAVSGYTTITITPNELPETGKEEQTITISGGELSRSIKLTLRSPYEFASVGCTTPSSSSAGGALTVNFELPTLPSSLFPLTFVVEADKHTLYPDTDSGISMPVVILENGSFGYERTVTLEEYTASKGIIDCYFKTNTANYTSDINVSNKYFNPGNTSIGSIKGFTDFTINGGEDVLYGKDREVVVTFNMSSKDAVNITAAKLKAATTTTGNCRSIGDGEFVYTPSNAGKQTITFTTAEFASAGSITLSATGYAATTKAYNNRLYVEKNKLNASLGLRNVAMYLDNSYITPLGTFAFTGTGNALSADMDIRNNDIAEDDKLYFRQGTDANNMRYAEIGVKELLDGNSHILIFEDKDGNVVREFSDFSVAEPVDIGFNKPVTISFIMSDNSPVTITTTKKMVVPTGVTNIKQISDFEFIYTPESAGGQTATLWTNELISAGRVSISAIGYTALDDAYNNRLYVPKANLRASERITSNVSIYRNTSYNSSLGTNYQFNGSDNLLNKDIAIEIGSSTTLGDKIYFRYGNNSSRRYASISLAELVDGNLHTLTFTTNSEGKMEFSNISINSGTAVNYGIGVNVPVSFGMANTDQVTIVADNMSVQASSTTGEITRKDNNTFVYTPRNAGNQTITFVTSAFASSGKITLSAENYVDGSKSFDNRIYVAIGGLKSADEDLKYDATIYTSNPGSNRNPSNKIGSCRFESGDLTGGIDITQSGLTNNTDLYFRYNTSSGIRKYYVASITLGELLSGGKTLNFSQVQ